MFWMQEGTEFSQIGCFFRRIAFAQREAPVGEADLTGSKDASPPENLCCSLDAVAVSGVEFLQRECIKMFPECDIATAERLRESFRIRVSG